MHVVAAVIDEGALTFDLAIPCEVHRRAGRGDDDELVPRRHDVAPIEAEQRTQTGFFVDTPFRLVDLERADTTKQPSFAPA